MIDKYQYFDKCCHETRYTEISGKALYPNGAETFAHDWNILLFNHVRLKTFARFWHPKYMDIHTLGWLFFTIIMERFQGFKHSFPSWIAEH